VSRKAVVASNSGGNSSLIIRPSTLDSVNQPVESNLDVRTDSTNIFPRVTEIPSTAVSTAIVDDIDEQDNSSIIEEEMRKLKEQRMRFAAR